ncbi:MAG: polymerase sigma factor [Candidatus Poribacteria bacterium]|nr:polymerase sigma factor [Candidatus Poribacteria bacterium]
MICFFRVRCLIDRKRRRTPWIKQIWFAPGVGPVKFIFDTGDGVHIHIKLAEYEIKESPKSDYFPLSVGNKWTYRWCGIDERYVNKCGSLVNSRGMILA